MRSKSSFVIIYWWLLLLSVLGVSLLLFAEKEERVSDSENRVLSGFPELSVSSVLSGEFASGFESFLSDGVFGRDDIVGISESILRIFSASTDEDDALLSSIQMAGELQGQLPDEDNTQNEPSDDGTIADLESDTPDVPGASESEDGTSADTEQSENANGASSYGLWLEYANGRHDRNIHTISEYQVKTVSETLNSFKSCLPEDGYVFYTNVPLTQTGHILKNDRSYSGWVENIDEGMSPYLNDGVYYINAIELMESSLIAGENVYFYSDHHWTPLGALKVVNECMRIQGVPTIGYDEYSYKINLFVNKEYGSKDDLPLLYTLQHTQGYRMYSGAPIEECSLIEYDYNTYTAYLGGDYGVWTKYTTGFSTGRRSLVIGDSFSNVFTPYLAPYYDEVYKTDARYFNSSVSGGTMSELIEKYEIDDVYIILSYANGVASQTSLSELENALYGYS